jgi:hypothetical protein
MYLKVTQITVEVARGDNTSHSFFPHTVILKFGSIPQAKNLCFSESLNPAELLIAVSLRS